MDGCVVQPILPELDGTFGGKARCLSGGQGRTGQAAVPLSSAQRVHVLRGPRVPAAPAWLPEAQSLDTGKWLQSR